METSSNVQSSVVEQWEQYEESPETLEKRLSNIKIKIRATQEQQDDVSAKRVTVVSQEDQLRTQYVPETKVQIMKRPSSNDADSSAANRPKAPIKTLEQRQAEYNEARIRILGNAEPTEAELKADAANTAESPKSTNAVAQGGQRGIITGTTAKQQQQQQQQSKQQRNNTNNKRNQPVSVVHGQEGQFDPNVMMTAGFLPPPYNARVPQFYPSPDGQPLHFQPPPPHLHMYAASQCYPVMTSPQHFPPSQPFPPPHGPPPPQQLTGGMPPSRMPPQFSGNSMPLDPYAAPYVPGNPLPTPPSSNAMTFPGSFPCFPLQQVPPYPPPGHPRKMQIQPPVNGPQPEQEKPARQNSPEQQDASQKDQLQLSEQQFPLPQKHKKKQKQKNKSVTNSEATKAESSTNPGAQSGAQKKKGNKTTASENNAAPVTNGIATNGNTDAQTDDTSPTVTRGASPDEGETANAESTVKTKKNKRKKKKSQRQTVAPITTGQTTGTISNKEGNGRIVRMPRGPDGTKGFNFVRTC